MLFNSAKYCTFLSSTGYSILKNSFAKHAFIENLQVPVILDNSVLLNEGTACVHSAPGCGPEDYALGVKNNLEIFNK